MKLFFDEDVGTGVPKALRNVGFNCEWVAKRFQKKGIVKGTPDEVWIPYAGRKGLLVFSGNRQILESEAQRQLWIDNKVGGVFLTSGQEKKADMLLLLLRRMAWLEDIHANTRRPFAYTTTIQGRWDVIKLQ